jgi:two-component system, NarL family, invasion response regulator UvrY
MTKKAHKIQVAIADDHSLLRSALANLIGSFGDYSVLFEANNGKEIRNLIHQHGIPDIMLVDVHMPEMDGFETTKWLHSNYPQIKVLVLSMLSDERTIIRMMRLGAKGYLLKNADPDELKAALDSVISKDVYLPDIISGKLISGLHRDADREEEGIVLNDRESEFLRWVCTELAYKDIAEKMNLSPRTIDDYRQNLFAKLKVHSRIGLVLYAIRNGIAEV